MQQAKRICFYCLHKLWLALAVLLVLLAVLISVLRYSLPYADDYKQHIEQLISERYGAQVSVGELSAGWQKFGPALLLRDLKLRSDSQPLQLDVAETRIRLDFWRSLLNRQLTAQHFELSGLTYYLDADSLFQVERSAALDPAPVLEALGTLFFHQLAYFSVLDSKFVLQSPDAPDLVVNIKKLDWTNKGNRHQGYGELALAGVTANTLSFIIDLHGTKLADTFGQLYLESDKLDLLPWFASLLPPSQKLQQANINFKAWGRIDNGLIRRFQVELAENSVSWQRDGQTQQLQLGQGQLLWQPQLDGWSLYSGPLTLAAADQQWPDFKLHLEQRGRQWLGGVQSFPLQAVSPLANLLAEDIAILQQLMQYQPSGQLEQLQWRLDDELWQLSGQFSDLQSQPYGDIPGVQDIDGQFWLSNTVSKVQLHSTANELRWDGLFLQPTAYDELAATFYWQPVDGVWQFSLPSLQLKNADLQLDASIRFDQRLQILARLQQVNAAHAARYFPQRYMPQSVSHYLTQAIQAGELSDATMLWHGVPREFPYREQQGVFQVLAQLQQGKFAFAPDWPVITDLSARLWFENAAMLIDSEQGELAGLALGQGVSASITDLFHAEKLDIAIAQQLPAEQVTALMLQSPLAANLGKTLQQLGVSGEVRGDVALAIGLHQRSAHARGAVQFDGLQLALQAPQMLLQDVSGSLTFDNDQINADQLKLNWRGLPLQAALQGENTAQGYQLALQVQGKQQAEQLLQALYAPAAGLAQGSTDWQLQLALHLPQQGFSYSARLQSTLQDTAILLPAPYQKTAAESGKLLVSVSGDAQHSLIAAHFNDLLHFHAELQHDTQQFSRVHLIASEQDSGLTGAGFFVTIDLPELAALPWFDVLQPLLSVGSEAEQPLFPPLTLVRGKVRQLTVAPPVALNNTVFELTQQPGYWQLQLNGTEIASQVLLSKNWQQEGISATLDYLHLPLAEPVAADSPQGAQVEALAQSAQRWFLQLPPISVSCLDCAIGNFQLGRVNAKAQSDGQQWQLTEFNARYKRSELNLSGFWQDDAGLGLSQFSGKIKTNNLGALLQEYQVTSAIAGSSADINFNLNWQGAPTQFALSNLAGDVDYRLGEGSLTEVSDKGARLFSIFSLDSLVRKLRLDFRDVFAKGFFYNNMTGSLALSHGVAQTSDAAIDGVPGSLQIQGYADLVSQKLDYQMAFSPKVTSSLPVIIAWMVNPATGLAALALDEVFQSAEVISKINFTVTGSFAQPVVTEVNRHSKEVPVPVRVAQPDQLNEQPQPPQPNTEPAKPQQEMPHG